MGTTSDVLQKLLSDAVEEGQGTEELGRAIRKEFTDMSRRRGLVIARTEMTDTINDGTHQTLRQEGHLRQEWSTVIDGRERVTHAEANGQVVDIDGVFRVGMGMARYPGDENLPPGERINCRCAIVAADLPADRRRALGKMFLRTHGSLERSFMIALLRAFRAQRDRILSRLSP